MYVCVCVCAGDKCVSVCVSECVCVYVYVCEAIDEYLDIKVCMCVLMRALCPCV